MKKGLTPVIATVLLIALAVISAVGIYFWSANIPKEDYGQQRPGSISVLPYDPNSGEFEVANTGFEEFTIECLTTSTGNDCCFAAATTLGPGEKAVCTMAPATGDLQFWGPGLEMATVIVGGTISLIGPSIVVGASPSLPAAESHWVDDTDAEFDLGSMWLTHTGSILLNRTTIPIINVYPGTLQDYPRVAAHWIPLLGPSARVVFQSFDGTDDEIRWSDESVGWTPATTLTVNAVDDVRGDIYRQPGTQTYHVAWEGSNGINKQIYYDSYTAGLGWTGTIQISNLPGIDNYQPRIVVDSGGIVHISWYDSTGAWPNHGIHYANSGTGWARKDITQAGKIVVHQSMDVDDSGNLVILAWEAADAPDSEHLGYSESVDAGVNFGAAAYIGTAAQEGAWAWRDDERPVVEYDSTGRWWLFWAWDNPLEPVGSQFDIVYINSDDIPIASINDYHVITPPGVAPNAYWDDYPDVYIENWGGEERIHLVWEQSIGVGDIDIKYAWTNPSNPFPSGYGTQTVSTDTINHDRYPAIWTEQHEPTIVWNNQNVPSQVIVMKPVYYPRGSLNRTLDTGYAGGQPANITNVTWGATLPFISSTEMDLLFSNNSFSTSAKDATVTNGTGGTAWGRMIMYNASLLRSAAAPFGGPQVHEVNVSYKAAQTNVTWTASDLNKLDWVSIEDSLGVLIFNETFAGSPCPAGPGSYWNSMNLTTDYDTYTVRAGDCLGALSQGSA